MSLSFSGRLAKRNVFVLILFYLKVRLNADIIGSYIYRIKQQILLCSMPILLLMFLIINESVKVNTENLEMFPASLKFVDHLICLVERYVLFSTEIKESLVAFLKLLLICLANVFLVKVCRITWKLKLLV